MATPRELLSDLRFRVRALFRRGALERELDDELRFHLELETGKLVKAGVAPAEAARRARIAFGGVDRIKEDSRDARGLSLLDTLARDIRYATRRLINAPGFTAITVLTLAVGIGAATAIFSALNPILFQSVPYPDPGRVATILELGRDGSRGSGTFALYRAFLERNRSFESIAVLRTWQPTVTGSDRPEKLDGQRVSAGYFRVLGVAPPVGRDFEPADDRLGGPNVVILSDALWHRRFAGDRAIVGREITLDDNPYTVIGVMPADFENVLAPSAGLWTTLQYDAALPAQGREWGHHLRTIGRLRPGIGADEATLETNAVGRAILAEHHPDSYDPATRFSVASLHDELTRGVRPTLLAILGAVVLVLVIACVNVTNLLLARGVQRRGEFALRAALGAGRGRLIRQLLTESLLLASLGGLAGMAVATLGVRAFVALSPAGLPRAGAIGIDGTVFIFGFAITTVIGLAFGILPALQAVPQGLRHGSSRSVGGHRRTRDALVVAEVALALVLLTGSGLLLRSLQRLFAVEVGFDSPGLVTMQVQASGHRYDSDSSTQRFYARSLDAVRQVPGVTGAGFTSQLPLSGDRDEYGAQFEPGPGRPTATYGVFRYAVSPGYLEALRIPLRRGRFIEHTDGPGAPLVALISESLARERFQREDPIGQRLRLGPVGPYTIVGVVGDVKQMSLALSESDAVYLPATQWPFPDRVLSLAVRTRGNPEALVPSIRQAIWSVDRNEPVARVATMLALLAGTAAERRFALLLFEAFALAALVLAAAGIYGVLAGSVAERTREIGVRAALGASRGMIVGLVVRQGLTLTSAGMVIGLAGAIASNRMLDTLLFGVSPVDPVTFLGVIVLLSAVALLACGVPAWRAARVDPATTLRTE